MTKLILSILLFVTVAKIAAPGSNFVYHGDFAQLVDQDEDAKKEKGDKGKIKYDIEDRFYPYTETGLSTSIHFIESSKPTSNPRSYNDLCIKPITPPPDLALLSR